MIRALKAFESQRNVSGNRSKPRNSNAHESGMKLISNPKNWFYNQLCGWRPDKDGKYHGIWKRLQNAEFKKLFTGDDLDIEEVEKAITTIAFVRLFRTQ